MPAVVRFFGEADLEDAVEGGRGDRGPLVEDRLLFFPADAQALFGITLPRHALEQEQIAAIEQRADRLDIAGAGGRRSGAVGRAEFQTAHLLGADAEDDLCQQHQRDVTDAIKTIMDQTEALARKQVLAIPDGVGIPSVYADHVNLLFDILTLAFQTDTTRVATFMFSYEKSGRSYAEIEAPGADLTMQPVFEPIFAYGRPFASCVRITLRP